MELKDEERTRCEVWSRVMGYHRPVNEWNVGKQQEHCDRTHFKETDGTEASNTKSIQPSRSLESNDQHGYQPSRIRHTHTVTK